jgi:hypothetical protein
LIRPLALALATTLSACTFWHRNDARLAEPLAPRDRVQIWIGTTAHDVHGIMLQGDSLTAIPSWKPPNCDSCRVAFARADVDSVRSVEVSGETVLISGVAVIVAFIVVLYRGLASNYP